MSKLGINTGSNPNDGQGDPLRVAMGKINSNFTEIYDTLGDGNNIISYASTSGISTLARNLTGSPRINVSGILNTGITTTEHLEVRNITSTGVITATQFVGDGSQLENVIATNTGVEVLDENVRKGVAKELNFGAGLFCSGPDGVGRVTIAVTTSIVSGGGTGGTPLEIRNQNVVLGEYSKLNFGPNLFATVNPSSGVVTVTTPSGGINVSGVSTFNTVVVGGSNTSLVVNGNARITGILTIGTSSLTLDGNNNQIKIGTGVTIKETGSASFNEGINASGIITASSFRGDGSQLTGIVTSLVGVVTSLAGYATTSYVTTQIGLNTFTGVASTITTTEISNWNTAYSWGNHSTVGYVTSLTLNQLIDVNAGAPSTGQVLKWSGTEWEASSDLTASGGIGIGLSDLSVTINPAGISSLTYNNLTGVFAFTPAGSVSYASSSGISTLAKGLTGTPNISVNQLGISSFLSVSGVTSFFNDVHFEYDRAVLIGNNDELQLYHNGANSYIDNSSGGNLIIRAHGGSIQIDKEGPELMGVFNTDGSVELYYNNSKKFETTGYGVTISGGLNATGVITATSFSGSGSNLTGIITTLVAGSNVTITQSSGIATISATGGGGSGNYATIAGYSTSSGISTVSQGLTGTPNITVGILTASQFNLTQGEIRVGFNSDFVLSLEDVEGSPTYTFGANGALNLPGNLEIGSGGYVLFNNLGSKLQSDPNYDFEIHVGGFANKVWAFSTDGSTTLPNGTKITDIGSSAGAYPTSGLALGNNGFQVSFGSTLNDWAIFSGANLIQFQSDNDLNLIANNSVNITGGGIEGLQWQFNSNGTITFPDNTVQTTAYTGYASTAGIATVAQGLTGTPNINVGVVTATSFSGSGVNLTGIITSLVAGTNVTITQSSGIATINATAGGGGSIAGIDTTGTSFFNQLNVSGVSTFSGITTNTSTLFANQLSVSGVSTFAGITTVTGVSLFSRQISVSAASTFAGITTVTGVSLFSRQLSVSGVSTFAGITTVTGVTLFAKQLDVAGIATASSFVGAGTSLTGLDASNISLGTLPNSRLPSDISVSGVVTATRFESTSGGTPTIGAATTISLETIKVAISTDVTVGRNANVSGIVTATGGFISVGNTTPIQISLVGNQLTFTAVGIGSTTLTLF